MDIQRILILLGLAVTSYLLVLAWNEDYGDRAPAPSDDVQVSTGDTTAPAPDIPSPEGSTGAGTAETTPAADELPQVSDIPEADRSTEDTTLPAPTAPAQDGRLVTVTTDVLELTIDRLGGDIEKASLPDYPAQIETPEVPYVLVDPRNNYAIQSGLIGPNGTDTAEGRPLFSAPTSHFALGDRDEVIVDLRHTMDSGVEITKRFRLRRGDYLIDVEYLVDNPTDTPWSAGLFGQIKRDSTQPLISESNSMGLQPYVGGATFKEGDPYTKLEFDDIAETSYRETVEGGYMAMVQHYFLSAWVPGNEETHTYRARKLSNRDVYLFEFTSPLRQVGPSESATLAAQFYVGPKNQYRLEEISRGLDLTVDYGFLWWLAQPLYDLLFLIHSVVNNWGVAIILLTCVVKALLYPLSAASFRSMAKMRKLQPEMARLKERYGDDRQQFSQAMMELYKKEGANPLGGCLPLLLQMPVFLALYWTLLESVELRQAPFMLWINDLSAKDPFFVLPILMGISMYVTQLLQPEPPDPMQARIFKLMPIMFTFFFLWFPAGLVLYWLINNCLSILQQWYVTRQLDKKG